MRNLIFSVVIFLLCLGVAELAVRTALPQPGFIGFLANQPPNMLQQHPTRSYMYRPGFSGDIAEDSGSVNVTINSMGMRDAELTQGEVIDFLAVGDSFTAGAMVEQSEAWPAQLQQQLTAATGQRVRVLNAGVSGYNMQQIRLAATELLALQPAALIVGAYPAVSGRLWNPFVWFDGYAVRESKRDWLALTDGGFLLATNNRWLSKESQFWLYENFYFAGWLWSLIAPYLETPDPPRPSGEELTTWFLDELDQLNQAAKAAGVPMIVFVLAHQEASGQFADSVGQYNQVVVDYCLANDIPVYDSYPLLSEYPVNGVEFRAGGYDFHWSALGHAVAAKGLSDYIVSSDLLPDAAQ